MLNIFEQRAKDSCLFYFFGEDSNNFSSDSVTILQTETYETEKIFVETHIIGQSHFFKITDKTSQKIIAIEALACVPMPQNIPTHRYSFEHSKFISCSFELDKLGLKITSSAKIVSAVDMDKQLWIDSLGSPKIFMKYSFPGNLSPQTLFSLHEGKDFFEIQTLHEFEEKNAITFLVTHTTITLLLS